MLKTHVFLFIFLIFNSLYAGIESDFFRACLNGDQKEIYKLYETHGKHLIYSKDRDGNTCLHLACCNKKGGNKNKIVQFLLDQGADVNVQNRFESTPLIIAITNRNYEVVEILLNVSNINPNIQDMKTYSPLQHAVVLHSPSMVKLILSNTKTNPNFGTADGATPLHFAAMWGYIEEACILINDSRTDLNVSQHDPIYGGATPLHFAALQAQHEIVKMLIDQETVNVHASVVEGLYSGFTPLHFAVMNPESVSVYETVKVLLNGGASPKKQSQLGKTPTDLTDVSLIKKLLQTYKKQT